MKNRTWKFRAAQGILGILASAPCTGLADFEAALTLRPKSAWSLYGRGIAKVRRGKAADGQADMSAAAAVWPPVAEDFAKRGITP